MTENIDEDEVDHRKARAAGAGDNRVLPGRVEGATGAVRYD